MANLSQRITEELKTAMKASASDTVAVLRQLQAATKNLAIEKRRELTDEEVLSVIRKEIKKRQEAAALYEKGGRPELASKEKAEADILQPYLPAQLSDAELTALVAQVVQGAATDAPFGPLMQELMRLVAGRADGKRVSVALQQVMRSS